MIQDVIRVADQYYILASSALADVRTRVLKQGETFAVFDRHGDVQPVGRGQQGLYHDGTRHLSRLTLRLGGRRPLLLSSNVREDNAALAVDLANRDILDHGAVALPADVVHLFRSAFLWDGACHMRVRVRSYAAEPIAIELSFQYEADFADIFEVRGATRAARGRQRPAEHTADAVVLSYEGLDATSRRTRISFSPAPERVEPGMAAYGLALGPGETFTAYVTVACEQGAPTPARTVTFDAAAAAARTAREHIDSESCTVTSSNEQVNQWLARSRADLAMMVTATEHGFYPYAGVPWFSTPFGRDGIITALEMLWIHPDVARGVLSFLAAHQADTADPERDAEPGKILHEMRGGEMAALGEIPFGCYYGSIDVTPLFVMLADAYFARTYDVEFLRKIWPHVGRALDWIDTSGDLDGDGFVEYARRSPTGLVNQGWKDSNDSVFHADGTTAEGPIALCEVQAYVYAARRGAARMAHVLGLSDDARTHDAAADVLRERFREAFWSDAIESFVLALDGRKRPCAVRASNAGHCLLADLATEEQAQALAKTMLSESMCSGWGIRTLAESERRYNPMSYHNGSVWPHDNAIIALGLSRYRNTDAALAITSGIFEASRFMELHRLPELFCGFSRRQGEGPTLYPVACSPQAWSAGAAFMLLEACLGMTIDGEERRVSFRYPRLPPFLRWLEIRGLKVGSGSLDLRLERSKRDVSVTVVEREGDVDVTTHG